jgi:hypothetical protein
MNADENLDLKPSKMLGMPDMMQDDEEEAPDAALMNALAN